MDRYEITVTLYMKIVNTYTSTTKESFYYYTRES